jgi:hypothetical protein
MRKTYVLAAVLLGVVVLVSTTTCRADGINFTSDGSITGTPGSTVGWGFTLTNNTNDWVLFTDLGSTGFSIGTPSSLFSSSGLQFLAPNQSDSVPFNANTGMGLYQLAINSGAVIGSSDSGTFTLIALLFNVNTIDFNHLVGQETVTADYKVTVRSTQVPEPTSLLLLTAGLLGIGIWRKRIPGNQKHC